MYSWYTLDPVDLENPSCLMISKIEKPMCPVPMICPRSKVSKSGSLPILVIPTTNSEQPQYALYLQLPQHSHLHMNDAQRYTMCIALAISNSVALHCIS
ncbi:UNVERIFIED_CONTAM: hypothetical protein NCL1_30047 [Trichonephila clavipes]